MARPEAVAKELYYPTPLHLMRDLGQRFKASGTIRMLDTCCGEGAALQAMALSMREEWQSYSHRAQKKYTYGVEVNDLRAQKAQGALDYVLSSPLESTFLCPGGWDVVFVNPPYDWNGEGGRLELDFLRWSLPCLGAGGYMVVVIPEYVLNRDDVQEWIHLNLREVEVFRFPEPDYQVFKQVVLIARRDPSEGEKEFKRTIVKPWSDLLSFRSYTVYSYGDTGDNVPTSLGGELTFEVVSSTPPPPGEDGVFGTRAWSLLVEDMDRTFKSPVLRPRPGHRAMMLAAGSLDGVQIEDFLVRARALRVSEETETREAVIETDRILTEFCTLDVNTGELERWTTDEMERTAEWIQKHSESLSRAVDESYQPQFEDSQIADYEERIAQLNPPGVLPGRDKPEWPLAQKRIIAAIHDYWERGEKAILLSGEMGLGKTAMGAASAALATSRGSVKKVVVVCPAHLVSKWQAEANKILGQKCSMEATKASHVERFFNDPAMRFLVLRKERAKLGCRFESGSARKRGKAYDYARCPKCGKNPYQEKFETKYERATKKREKCIHCGEPQWCYIPLNAKGTKRWPLAKVLSRYARRFHLILDEAHQYSSAQTDQSKAVQRLIANAVKVVAMTGTVYSGRASSLFHLLYKLSYSFRQQYRYDEVARFSQHHGLFESVVKNEECRYSVSGYRRGTEKARVKEIPGMSPSMIPLLLPMTLFVKLADLGENLPPYSEELRILQGDPKMIREAKAMQDSALADLRKYPQGSGSYLMSCLGYPDRPEQDDQVVARMRDEETGEFLDEIVVLGRARAVTDAVNVKDQEVLKEALAEQKHGRRVLVYCTQTEKRDVRHRLKALLEENGLKACILPSSVAPDKRMAWVRKQEKEGFDVMITNGRLVETGVDLMWATTIIQYGIEYSVNSLRQSTRRSWRLGQLHPVRVLYLAYAGTLQETAIELIAEKMKAAELVDGDELGGLAQSGGGDIATQLLRGALE